MMMSVLCTIHKCYKDLVYIPILLTLPHYSLSWGKFSLSELEARSSLDYKDNNGESDCEIYNLMDC